MSQSVQPLKMRSAEEHFLAEIEQFKATEEEGRRRASERENFPRNDSQFLQRVYTQARMMENRFDDLEFFGEGRFAEMIKMAAYWAIPEVRACEVADVPRQDCIIAKKEVRDGIVRWVDLSGRESHPFSALHIADDYSVTRTGRRCTYLRGEVDPYNESAFLNDLTACFHLAMDIYRDKVGKWRSKGKCVWSVV